MDSKKIGKFIQELRKEKNLTQENLANELFTVRETISKWERGVYIPTNEMLLKLGQLFDIKINEILCGERENQINNKIRKENNYIRLSDKKTLLDYDIKKIRLYYVSENKECDIFSSSKNEYNYNMLFQYENLEQIKNNLYLEIKFINNNIYVLELTYKKENLNTILVKN